MDSLFDHVLLVGALGAATLALLAGWGDRRRRRRQDLDRVGIMPWTGIAFWATLAALLLLAAAVQGELPGR